MIDSNKTFLGGGGQDNTILSVMVANNTILSVMVANNELPVIVERNSGNNESTIIDSKQTWFINFRKEPQGLVITDHAMESHYYDFHTPLSNTF